MNMPVDTALIQALDREHFLHPFTDFKDLASRGARVITRDDNIYVWDFDGHKMLDAMSGLWCVNVGYGRKELADAAYQQMMRLRYYNSFFQTTNLPAVQLAAKLADLAPEIGGHSFKHVFYSGSGSESNDSNVRMVRRYWDLLDQPQCKVIIGRVNGYHDSTMPDASLGGMRGMHAQGDLPIPDITHIGQPYFYELGQPGEAADEFGLRAAQWLEDKILEVGPSKVAAFIAEPVQGAGGVIIPPNSYWPKIQRIVDKYGILLISDEVICAFGRVGQWFACEKFGCRPDLITLAKAVTSGYIPLGRVMVGNRVAKVLIGQGGEFNHGYTYSGHPVACPVALANIDLMEKENLPARVKNDVGPYLALRFAELKTHPLVGLTKTCGFMAGLVLVKNKATHEAFKPELGVGMLCRCHCFWLGLIMRAVGDRMIVAPPLVMTYVQIDEIMMLIRSCLDATLLDLKVAGQLG